MAFKQLKFNYSNSCDQCFIEVKRQFQRFYAWVYSLEGREDQRPSTYGAKDIAGNKIGR